MNSFNTKLLKKIVLITSLGFTAILATSAQAGTDSATIQLNTQVVANCTISADALNVSGYDSIVANKSVNFDKESNVTVTCTKDTGITIGLDQGANGRHLKSGDNLLAYELYQDASRSKVWGNDGDALLSATGTGLAETKTVYVRVPQNQNVPAGTYTDTIIATVSF